MVVNYDPYSEEAKINPWPIYKRLREEAPAYYIEKYDAWALSRFEDVWRASMDAKSFTATHGTSMDALFLSESLSPSIFLFKDPPAHTVSRNVISMPYRKENVALLDNKIRACTRALLRTRLEQGRVDVYELASRVALNTIADFIGLEVGIITELRALIDKFYYREPGIDGATPDGLSAFAQAREIVLKLIESFRRNRPELTSHIGAWLDQADHGNPMSDEELFFSIFAMIVTGSDTVPLTTAATVYYLAEHPGQLALVRSNPALIPQAYEEAARFDQPTNILGRMLIRDVEFHGKAMTKGQKVLFLYASANRDENEFEQADAFMIGRRPRRSLSFGVGSHFCLGQHLARLEGKIILEELFSAIPEFFVETDKCLRIYGEFLQGFNCLPIRFREQDIGHD